MQSRFRLNIPLSYTIRHCPEILVGDPMLSPESQSVTHNRCWQQANRVGFSLDGQSAGSNSMN